MPLTSKPKILHVLFSNSFSGAENVAITIMRNMNNDFNFAYTSPDGPIREYLEKEQMHFIPIESFILNPISLKKVIDQFNPDIIHAHDFIASYIASRFYKKCKIISHIHCNPTWIKHYNIFTASYIRTLSRYSALLAVSQSVPSEFYNGNKHLSKMKVVGNPIDVYNIKKLAQNSSYQESFDIIYLGRLNKEKNPIRFIEIISNIASQIPNVKAAIIGSGPLEEKCNKTIIKNNLSKNIKLFGFLKNPYGVLKNCKLLIITSEWEGFGLVALEAVSLDTPVLCTSVGGLKSIFDDNSLSICNSNEDFTNKAIQILCHNNIKNKICNYCKISSNVTLDISEYCNNLKQIYNSILQPNI